MYKKNAYSFMYFYTFFNNNNTMNLIVSLLKNQILNNLKEETSVI